MKVNICGIPHTVIGCEDHFDVDTHFGQIDYKACEIRINKDLATEAMEETICHEMIHGILVHLGYSEQSQDETFVQALGNAIYQGFVVRVIEESDSEKAFDDGYKNGYAKARFDYEQQHCEDVLDKIWKESEVEE